MAEGTRAARLADRIKVLVAQQLERGVKDPRLGFVTITEVRVTGDLQHAKVYYTVYGTDAEQERSTRALRSATGVIRREVGRGLHVRLIPTLEFVPDSLPEDANAIDALVARARERDQELAERSSGAEYAGGPDPYTRPRDADGDAGGDA